MMDRRLTALVGCCIAQAAASLVRIWATDVGTQIAEDVEECDVGLRAEAVRRLTQARPRLFASGRSGVVVASWH